jgi:hypothetical protein
MLKFHSDELRGEGYRSMKNYNNNNNNNTEETLGEQKVFGTEFQKPN